jgi:RNA polymerase sigma-70 factor, ECF subfamily
MNDFSPALPNELSLVTQATLNTAAFAALYDYYFSRVYNYVRYRLQDADATDDVTAQVFERALNSIGSYRPEKAPFSAWLFAIARNAVNDYLRAQRRRRWLSLDLLWEWGSSEPQPVEIVAADELQHKLLGAVARLDSRERDLIGLKFAAGLTNRRIAKLTGLSENNVGVILYRAVRRLRAELKAQGVER